MINLIKGKRLIPTSVTIDQSRKYFLDLGCGDGKFIYNLAKINSNNFYVGIDSSVNLLDKISQKIYNKPAKGGLANLLFVQANAYNLPIEFTGIFDCIYINFPWGNLLEGVVKADEELIKNLKMCLKHNGKILLTLTFDNSFESTNFNLPDLDEEYIKSFIVKQFESWNLKIDKFYEMTEEDKKNVKSSWGKRLIFNKYRTRKVFCLEFIYE